MIHNTYRIFLLIAIYEKKFTYHILRYVNVINVNNANLLLSRNVIGILIL